jgi:hypothetical protein
MPVPLKLKVMAPTTLGVYINVNDELPFVGVTVTVEVPGAPTLGVIAPPCEPSAMMIVIEPFQFPETFETVNAVDAL